MSGKLEETLVCLDCEYVWSVYEHPANYCPKCGSSATWYLLKWLIKK